jgi:hypothetical protein
MESYSDSSVLHRKISNKSISSDLPSIAALKRTVEGGQHITPADVSMIGISKLS